MWRNIPSTPFRLRLLGDSSTFNLISVHSRVSIFLPFLVTCKTLTSKVTETYTNGNFISVCDFSPERVSSFQTVSLLGVPLFVFWVFFYSAHIWRATRNTYLIYAWLIQRSHTILTFWQPILLCLLTPIGCFDPYFAEHTSYFIRFRVHVWNANREDLFFRHKSGPIPGQILLY